MASLQPVDEAVQMVQDYYIYIIAFVVVLIFSFVLLFKANCQTVIKINDTTKKIAHLDFTEKYRLLQKMKLVIYRKILIYFLTN